MKVLGYLQDATGRQKIIVILPEDIREISGKGANTADWLEKYLNAMEKIDEGLPDTRGNPRSTTVYFESDHAHDPVAQQLVSGVMCFVGVHPYKLV